MLKTSGGTSLAQRQFDTIIEVYSQTIRAVPILWLPTVRMPNSWTSMLAGRIVTLGLAIQSGGHQQQAFVANGPAPTPS